MKKSASNNALREIDFTKKTLLIFYCSFTHFYTFLYSFFSLLYYTVPNVDAGKNKIEQTDLYIPEKRLSMKWISDVSVLKQNMCFALGIQTQGSMSAPFAKLLTSKLTPT